MFGNVGFSVKTLAKGVQEEKPFISNMDWSLA